MTQAPDSKPPKRPSTAKLALSTAMIVIGLLWLGSSGFFIFDAFPLREFSTHEAFSSKTFQLLMTIPLFVMAIIGLGLIVAGVKLRR